MCVCVRVCACVCVHLSGCMMVHVFNLCVFIPRYIVRNLSSHHAIARKRPVM